MPQDPYIREKFTKGSVTAARKYAREYFERYPRDPLGSSATGISG